MALHARGCAVLPLSVWSVAVAALDDGSESVREAAVSLTGVLAHLYGAEPAPGAAASSTQAVVDRAFVLLCNAVNDATLRVRCRAAGLLGSFDGVDQLVLLQALSKKPPPGTATPVTQAEGSAVRSWLLFLFDSLHQPAHSTLARCSGRSINRRCRARLFTRWRRSIGRCAVRHCIPSAKLVCAIKSSPATRSTMWWTCCTTKTGKPIALISESCVSLPLSHTHAQCGTPERHSLATPYGCVGSIVVACRSLGDAALSLVRGCGAHP